MVTRLLGRKLGMTQVYNDKGQCFSCTVIEAGPCAVTQVKTKAKDGYDAVQLSFGERRARLFRLGDQRTVAQRQEC